jgi:hypothetical protein
MSAQSRNQIEINETTQLCSFDIEYTYTRIPIHEVKNIIKDHINKNNNLSKETKKNNRPPKWYIGRELYTT